MLASFLTGAFHALVNGPEHIAPLFTGAAIRMQECDQHFQLDYGKADFALEHLGKNRRSNIYPLGDGFLCQSAPPEELPDFSSKFNSCWRIYHNKYSVLLFCCLKTHETHCFRR